MLCSLVHVLICQYCNTDVFLFSTVIVLFRYLSIESTAYVLRTVSIPVHLLIISIGILQAYVWYWLSTDSVCSAEVTHRRVSHNECVYNVHRYAWKIRSSQWEQNQQNWYSDTRNTYLIIAWPDIPGQGVQRPVSLNFTHFLPKIFGN